MNGFWFMHFVNTFVILHCTLCLYIDSTSRERGEFIINKKNQLRNLNYPYLIFKILCLITTLLQFADEACILRWWLIALIGRSRFRHRLTKTNKNELLCPPRSPGRNPDYRNILKWTTNAAYPTRSPFKNCSRGSISNFKISEKRELIPSPETLWAKRREPKGEALNLGRGEFFMVSVCPSAVFVSVYIFFSVRVKTKVRHHRIVREVS